MKKRIAVITIALLLLTLLAGCESGASGIQEQVSGSDITKIEFTDKGVKGPSSVRYTVKESFLTICSDGIYRISGKSKEGSIIVGEGLKDVTLILDGLELSSEITAPLLIETGSSVLLVAEGENTLSENGVPKLENVLKIYEGAAIKVKAGSSLTICGDGKLKATGSSKNGIKGVIDSRLVIDGGTIDVKAANNGISFDGSIEINGGSVCIESGNDGIKSDPEPEDTVSEGRITINGGDISIEAGGDGIQAGKLIEVGGGSFHIKTGGGHDSASFDPETMSCKGLKASRRRQSGDLKSGTVSVCGGTFEIDAADDAIHADEYVKITAGTFSIYAGDDAVHADLRIDLGTEGGLERDPQFDICACYEGIDACDIYTYSGKYSITADDDGFNASGSSSNRPHSKRKWGGLITGNNHITVYGGDFFIDCKGDGLDSNGYIDLLGGRFTILSQHWGGYDSPLDAGFKIYIDGAEVLGLGTDPLEDNPSEDSQICYLDEERRSAGKIVSVYYGGELIHSVTNIRRTGYLLFTFPGMDLGALRIEEGTEVPRCVGSAWNHDWDDGSVEAPASEDSCGVMVYTCRDCGKTERKTIDKIIMPEKHTVYGE